MACYGDQVSLIWIKDVNFFLFLADRPSTSSVSNMQEGKNKDLPSFWVPSMTPAANATKMDKPVMLVYY